MRESLQRLEGTVVGFARQTEAATGSLHEAVSGATSAFIGTANSVKETGNSIASVGGLVGESQLTGGDIEEEDLPFGLIEQVETAEDGPIRADRGSEALDLGGVGQVREGGVAGSALV